MYWHYLVQYRVNISDISLVDDIVTQGMMTEVPDILSVIQLKQFLVTDQTARLKNMEL